MKKEIFRCMIKMVISSQNTKIDTQEGKNMIIMDIKINNFMLFKNFHMNMSYPKKIVDSCIEGEFLKERKNFRYKKVNIIMGANAVGKTSIGKFMMHVLNFIKHKKRDDLIDSIGNKSLEAGCSVDFVDAKYNLTRVDIKISPQSEKNSDLLMEVCVRSLEINKRDNYETCVRRIEELPLRMTSDVDLELEKVPKIGWMFGYSEDSVDGVDCEDSESYPAILDYTLRALDPSIIKVEKLNEVKDSYVVRTKLQDFIIQDGEVIRNSLLSSGTKAGIDVARMLSGICEGSYGFYYCDELFSYVHSDIEKAFLSVMINKLKDNQQLFFTTHNSDVLDMQLPKHTFCFLKKDVNDAEEPIKCIEASKYLKRNTDSLRHAIENDLFSTAPNLELIYEIENL